MRRLDERTYDKLELVIDMVREELLKAATKHASMNSAHEGHSVIREELHELWDHVRADTGRSVEARNEAIQIAAMGARYVLDLCELDALETTTAAG